MEQPTGVLLIGEYGDVTLYPFNLTGPVEDVKADVDLDDLTTGESVTVNGKVVEVAVELELSDTSGYEQPWDDLSADGRAIVELYFPDLAAKASMHADAVDRHLYGGR